MNDESFQYIGKVNKNRLKMNTLMKTTNFNHEESFFYQKDKVTLCQFKDKRELYLFSNVKNNSLISDTSFQKVKKINLDIEKPFLLKKYGELMKGVDINNQFCSYFCFDYIQNKWWRAVFLRLIYISITNLYLLHRQSNGTFSHKMFIIDIIENLLKRHS